MNNAGVRSWRSSIVQHFRHSSTRRRNQRPLVTLAIETSCDDTAVAVLEKPSTSNGSSIPRDKQLETGASCDNRTLSRPVATKPALKTRLLFNERITANNKAFGGIHPIESLESHQANLATLISKAIGSLPDASSETQSSRHVRTIRLPGGGLKQLPDFISVTRGPGMRSSLACGLDTAKGLATAWQIPLLALHHMQAHALTPRLVSALEGDRSSLEGGTGPNPPKFPFLTLLVSGGHSMILHSKGLTDHKILATTRDVAIGDVLDKCGRIILPDHLRAQTKDTAFARYLSDYAFPDAAAYQTWPIPTTRHEEIDKARNSYGWHIKSPLAETKELAFSFTSIHSSIERFFKRRMEETNNAMSESERLLFARTALGIAFEHLASRTIIALQSLKAMNQDISTLVVSGGVAANTFLRYFLRQILDARGFQHVSLSFPPPWLCTDNAAMVAWLGMEMFEAGHRSSFDVRALRTWSMDATSPDGGILGVDGWE